MLRQGAGPSAHLTVSCDWAMPTLDARTRWTTEGSPETPHQMLNG
jgi:hypothetical protein